MLLALRSLYESEVFVSSETGQGQSSSVVAGVSYEAVVESGQAQSSDASAGVSYDLAIESSQTQSSSILAGVSYDLSIASSQAQTVSLAGSVGYDLSISTSSAQTSSIEVFVVEAPSIEALISSGQSNQSTFLDGLIALQSDGEDGAVIIEMPKRDVRWLG